MAPRKVGKSKSNDDQKVKKTKAMKQKKLKERPAWNLYGQPPPPRKVSHVIAKDKHPKENESKDVVDDPKKEYVRMENTKKAKAPKDQGQGQGQIQDQGQVKVKKKSLPLPPRQPQMTSVRPSPSSHPRPPPSARPPLTSTSRNEESNNSFSQLIHQSASTLDLDLKNILMHDSMETMKTSTSETSGVRKKNFLDIARTEAEICDVIRMLEEADDPEDEVSCCFSRRAKERKDILELGENDVDNEDRITTQEIWMRRIQRVMKWGVVLTAVFDFFLAVEDIYRILLRQMQIEYLFLIQIYNCDVLINGGQTLIIWTNVIHCVFCVGLLFVKNRETCGFAIYWVLSQLFMISIMVIEAFFRARFNPKFPIFFLSFLYWRLPIDLLQLSIVIFRYYKLDNPFAGRLKIIAADARLDRSLNNELRLRNSPFLQSKCRMREAAAFQTLEIIRKVEECVKSSGIRSRKNIIEAELRKALHVLRDANKYPRKQTIAQAQMKKEKLDDEDEVTIFQPSKDKNVMGES